MVNGGITVSVIKYKAVYGLKKNIDLYQNRANIDTREVNTRQVRDANILLV